MVERPIKKSERQAVTESTQSNDVVKKAPKTEPSIDEGAQDSITQTSEERSTTRPLIAKDKKKGKGRGDQRKDEQANKPPVNLALMRGPKPTKPKPPAIQAPQEATEADAAAATEQEET